jgi:hypothetical protein
MNTMTGWMDRVRFLVGARDFSTPVSRPALGHIQPPIQWVREGSLSLEVKQPGRETDHSLPSSATVKNGGAISPLTHTSWHGN